MVKQKIVVLVDYKGFFGSKHTSQFYRSGMDLRALKKCLENLSYEMEILNFAEVDLVGRDWQDQPVIYTSQEDPGYTYKDFIEDIVYGLELAGAILCPAYRFLRADNNKVFMEILRNGSHDAGIQSVASRYYGTFEEFAKAVESETFPLIFKTPQGAKSHGVFKADNREEALRIARNITKIRMTKTEYKDMLRPYKHKGYVADSRHRIKFITQSFVPGLANDWKVLVFGDKYFLEYRGVRDNDFRASGSQKFLFDDDIYSQIPKGLFEYAEHVRDMFGMPHWSIDIGCKDGAFYLFEFQALYFSSYAQEHSKTYFQREGDEFVRKEGLFSLEQLYAESLVGWLKKLPK